MIEVKCTDQIQAEHLSRLIKGYQSPARYRVIKNESDLRTEIVLEKESLAQPYVKQWELTEADFTYYQRVITEGHSLVAYDQHELVGLALAEVRNWNRTLWIWEFHVAEAYRRRGIGRQMMDSLEQEARELNLRTMLVEVQNTNLPAIHFYYSTGFVIEGVDLSYYSNHDYPDGEIAIFMKRRVE